MFEVDAPLAGQLHGDSDDDESDDDEVEESGDNVSELDGDESEEDDDESDEENDEESESGSDSGPEYDAADAGDLSNYIESGPNAPRIEVPAGVYDLPQNEDEEERKSGDKGKGKAVWHDPSDDLISVDLEKDNRLKKLARGKKGSTVNGLELMKRLRKQ